MDLRTLQYFVTIVEEKTITAAAEKLHMTQPPLTMQLHALERELGCSLFRREGRGLKLTDAGRQMYRRATEILNMCANAKQEMTEYRLGARGVLRIGVISSVQGTVFSEWMAAYHNRYPNIQISVVGGNTYQLLERLTNHELDLAVTRTPFAADGLDVSYLQQEEIFAVGHKRFFQNTGTVLSLEALSHPPLIIYRRWQHVIEAAFEHKGLTPNIYCINDDAPMTLALSLRGLGVGLMHQSALPTVLPPDMSALPLPEKTLLSQIALVCLQKEALSEPAVHFWNLIETQKNSVT